MVFLVAWCVGMQRGWRSAAFAHLERRFRLARGGSQAGGGAGGAIGNAGNQRDSGAAAGTAGAGGRRG